MNIKKRFIIIPIILLGAFLLILNLIHSYKNQFVCSSWYGLAPNIQFKVINSNMIPQKGVIFKLQNTNLTILRKKLLFIDLPPVIDSFYSPSNYKPYNLTEFITNDSGLLSLKGRPISGYGPDIPIYSYFGLFRTIKYDSIITSVTAIGINHDTVSFILNSKHLPNGVIRSSSECYQVTFR